MLPHNSFLGLFLILYKINNNIIINNNCYRLFVKVPSLK